MYWTERLSTPGSQAVATPVFHKNLLWVSGLMFKLEGDRPAASILWPKEMKVSARILSIDYYSASSASFFFKFGKSGVEIALTHELATRARMGTLKRQHPAVHHDFRHTGGLPLPGGELPHRPHWK